MLHYLRRAHWTDCDAHVPHGELALLDLLHRLLASGLVFTGDVTISLADVDLVHVSLRALISWCRPWPSHERRVGRLDADAESIGEGLGRLVLTAAELLRQLNGRRSGASRSPICATRRSRTSV